MSDDDLRFGDVSGGSGGGDIADTMIEWFQAAVILVVSVYVVLLIIQLMFGIDIPFISGPVGI